MALVMADRVQETSTTTGTGTLTLAGAVTGFQTFSAAVGNGNTVYYTITDQTSTANWEVGLGTYTSAGNTLARTTVLSSSAAGAAVNFTSGALYVFGTYPGAQAVYEDASNNVTGYAISGGSINNTPIGATTPNTIAGTTLTLTNALGLAYGGTGATTSNAAHTNLMGFATTATAGATTTLTNTSSYYQVFTGTLAQTIQLPATSTLQQGWSFHLVNNSTGTLTVQTSTAVSLGTIPPGVTMMPSALTTTGNTAADWETGYTDFSTLTGTGNNVLSTSPTLNYVTLAAGTATAGQAPLYFTTGTNLGTAAAGAHEYDGAVSYFTNETTGGRGYVPATQTFRLTAAGTAIGNTIANFFGTTSNIPLVSGAFYEIEIIALALRGATAGTAVWTFTNTVAPTLMVVDYEQSPLAGVAAPPGSVTALTNLYFRGTTSTTLAAYTFTTGTLAASVNHYFRFKILLNNSTGTSLKIQMTAGTAANTMTPQAGSVWFCRRLPGANTGTFAA